MLPQQGDPLIYFLHASSPTDTEKGRSAGVLATVPWATAARASLPLPPMLPGTGCRAPGKQDERGTHVLVFQVETTLGPSDQSFLLPPGLLGKSTFNLTT